MAVVIGITGGTATGKGTITRAISKVRDVAVLAQDDYYVDKPTGISSSVYNYDHPQAIDLSLLADHLILLKEGSPVESPIYRHAESKRIGSRTIYPQDLIIVEGILIMNDERLKQAMDLKVYLELDHETQLARRIARDIVERNCTEDKVRHMWNNTVLPMQLQFVEPHKEHCHLILEEGETSNMVEKILTMLEMRTTPFLK